jgi:ubiquinone/menaquinone biosynthesis C-methylase UbiE
MSRQEEGDAMITNGGTELREEWRQLAPAWITETRQGTNSSRRGLLDQPMIEACGDVRSLKVLDCGCGEGRFCRMLLDRGAEQVVGVDLCPTMIIAAAQLATGKDNYVLADVQDMGFLRDSVFDIVVSYLNQCDLPDFEANSREVFRVLKPGGRFIVANLHPMRSAVGGWLRAEDGAKLHVILDRYFDEGVRRWKMLGVDFTNFHRTLSTYIRTYRRTGFAIEEIIEPTPDTGNLKRFPELDDELRVPNFIIVVLGKPANAQVA